MNYSLPPENNRTNFDLVCIPDDQDLRPEVPLADWTGVLFSHFDPVCLGTYPLLLDLQVFRVKEAAMELQILRVRCMLNISLKQIGYKLKNLPGLVTNSIIYCRLFKIKDRCKQVRFQHTNNQGLRQLLLTVSWDLRA